MENETAERRRITAKVLALLDESWQAHVRGDNEAMHRAAAQARELDPFCVDAVRGGIMIGELPDPDRQPQEWAEYVQAAQDYAANS